jgi:hypothetical protein
VTTNCSVQGGLELGSVYKVLLQKLDMQVAVKVSHESNQGMKKFISVVVSMGRLRHRNLAQLLGYCPSKGELLALGRRLRVKW